MYRPNPNCPQFWSKDVQHSVRKERPMREVSIWEANLDGFFRDWALRREICDWCCVQELAEDLWADRVTL